MLGFSEYLQSFMKINSISMVELSKETNIDRTVIYRYVKGSRVPSDLDVVIRIADAMQMSVSEKRRLIEEYDKLVLGEPMVYSYQYIQKLFQSLNESGRSVAERANQWGAVQELKMSAPVIELGSREEITTYVLDLFRYIANQGEKEKVYIVMQPDYSEIQRLIPQIFGKSEIEIEQIVCMEQNISQGYRNLKVFQGVLSCLFSLSKYEAYYYYDSLHNHINNMTAMPNIILVQDYVVQFDYNMEHGIAIKNEVFASTMKKQYSMLRKEVRSLLVRGNEPKTINDFLPKVENKEGEIGCFSEQLCMAGCLDREMLEKHIYPNEGREELIETILDTKGAWNGLERKEKTYGVDELLSYGSYKGVEDFMKTGRIKEFPEALYTPLTVEERKQVLARVIFLLKEKGVRYRFVSDKVVMPGSIHIYWIDGKKRFALNQITDTDILQIVVDEQSIYRTFQMYLEYLEKKGLVCSEEKTLKELLKLQKKFGGGNTCLVASG